MQVVIAVVLNQNNEILVHKRTLTKFVSPGDVYLVCGGVKSEESPIRKTLKDITVITQGVNEHIQISTLCKSNQL